jgi:hypothetical protein
MKSLTLPSSHYASAWTTEISESVEEINALGFRYATLAGRRRERAGPACTLPGFSSLPDEVSGHDLPRPCAGLEGADQPGCQELDAVFPAAGIDAESGQYRKAIRHLAFGL